MKTAYINCRIRNSEATAVLVEDSIIARVGTTEEILKEDPEETVDLCGMYLMPSFADTHMHLLGTGRYLSELILNGSTLKQIGEKLKKAEPQNGWIIGRGYSENDFDEGEVLNKAFLDSISTEVPIALTRVCGHKMTVNSKVLEIIGISEDYIAEGARIIFATGAVEENAIPMVHNAEPVPDEKMLKEYIRKASAYCNAKGITVCGSDDFLSVVKNYKPVLNAFEQMSFQEEMTVRVNQQCEFNDAKEFSGFLDEGYTMDVGNDFFRIGPLKMLADGSMGAHTAALTKPYLNDGDNAGYLCESEDDIRLFVKLANRFNMATIIHAIGDKAVDTVLKVFDEEVLEGNPLHHGLVHCQIMREDQVKKVLEKKISCYIQTLFIDEDAQLMKQIPEDLRNTSYPYRTLFEGTIASNGSDSPVELPDPLRGILLAETRTSLKTNEFMEPETEKMSRTQAIDSYVSAGCRQLFMDDRLGEIREGYLADFIVLDNDIDHCDQETLKKTSVQMTVMNGRTVYEKH
ncbi:MAG: amidohydrolase [Solobacterium sp.]|nr:amidohydrolase [Solobacterium sp.]